MTSEYEIPFKFQELSDEEKELVEWFSTDIVKLPPTRSSGPSGMKNVAKEIYNLKPRPDDIWLIGFPRSGTTLTQEVLYLLGTDLNYEKAASKIMDLRFPVLHSGAYSNEGTKNLFEKSGKEVLKDLLVPAHKLLEGMTEKRFIKSHYGFDFIHPEILEIGCKVVFIARNPKDVLVSFNNYPIFKNFPEKTFEKVWKLFKYDIFFGGNYFEMLKEAWERRNNKNFLYLIYEDVNADKRGAVKKIATFLERNITEAQLEELLDHLDIKKFKNNKSLNNDHLVDIGLYEKSGKSSFIGKGENGSWKTTFPPELVPEIDEWIRQEFAKIPGFEIPLKWKEVMEI